MFYYITYAIYEFLKMRVQKLAVQNSIEATSSSQGRHKQLFIPYRPTDRCTEINVLPVEIRTHAM